MQGQIENLAVLAPLPHSAVQCVSGEDLGDQMRGGRSLTTRYLQTPNVNRAEFVPVVLEEFLESGIRQLYAALPVENDDCQRAILYQRVQIGGLFIQIDSQALPLTDLRSHDES